jgi:hypothetical protein
MELLTGGFWSAYWYNGRIYGSEITRGLDVLELQPSPHLTENEIEAARLVRYAEFNPQNQPRVTWEPSFVVARAYLDQLLRSGGIGLDRGTLLAYRLDLAEDAAASPEGRAAIAILVAEADRLLESAGQASATGRGIDARRLTALANVIGELTNP